MSIDTTGMAFVDRPEAIPMYRPPMTDEERADLYAALEEEAEAAHKWYRDTHKVSVCSGPTHVIHAPVASSGPRGSCASGPGYGTDRLGQRETAATARWGMP